jgi:chromosome segregation ATPase
MFFSFQSSLVGQLKTAQEDLSNMKQKLSESERKIAQLRSVKKVLEGQLKMREDSFDCKAKGLKKTNKAAEEQVTKLEKERDGLKLRFVLHFHPFPFTPSSPSI